MKHFYFLLFPAIFFFYISGLDAQTFTKKTGDISPVSFPADKNGSMSGNVEWRIIMKDDNGNTKLPPTFRNWWYVKIEGIDTLAVSTITVIGDGWRGGDYVIPVYSYNNINWHRLDPDDIDSVKGSGGFYNYTIKKRFDSSSTVWMARYYPYTNSRLTGFLKKFEKNPFVKIDTIGLSEHGRPIRMVTITDPKVDNKNKKRVWIHARTHPSETGSSFVAEGLIDFIAGDCNLNCKKADLGKLIFHIVPILNVDGVAEGMSRVTPGGSIDLERQWHRLPGDNFNLSDSCATEVKILHDEIAKLLKAGPEFIVALNLHSKNAEPAWRPFIYTNFRKSLPDHGIDGDSLFLRHLQFAVNLSKDYCGDTIDVRGSYDPGMSMDKKPFPESWWWANFRSSVLAMTIETTSGYGGCFEEWVNYRDHQNLGEALASAIQLHYRYYIERNYDRYQAPVTDMKILMKYFKGPGSDMEK